MYFTKPVKSELKCLGLFYCAVTIWSIVNNMKTVYSCARFIFVHKNTYPVIIRNFDHLLIKHCIDEDKTFIVVKGVHP